MLLDKLEFIENKYDELSVKISDPSIMQNQNEWRKLCKEHADLEVIVNSYREYKKVVEDLKANKEMLSGESDKEMREMLNEEITDLTNREEQLETEIQILLLPKDPNDDKNVRITHLPTGLVVSCQDEKSQLKNKEKAMKVLKSRLYEQAERERAQGIAEDRKSQVGTGDRSERIRTYNYPQGRITDHRIGLTLYKLDTFLGGDIDEMINALITADQAEKMKLMGNTQM